MTTACQCAEAGWCGRHQVHKSARLVQLCQTRENYFRAWEEGRGPGQGMPALKRPQPSGPGTQLCRILGCGCGIKQHMAQLNAWGVDGCREHTEQIVAWLTDADQQHQAMTEEAARRLLGIAIERAANSG